MQQRDLEPKGNRVKGEQIRLLVGILFLQGVCTICIFCFCKQGFHSDELWSYGYANSYMDKDIYVDEYGLLDNVEKWTAGEVLWDYLVVNEGEEFAYKHVYNNQIKDLSPPLHSMVLHTICSFFPESFSKWYSFIINILSYIVTMIFLYKTAGMLSSDRQAYMVCILYGFSRGAIDNFIYLRMYAMCTAELMVILYCMIFLLMNDGKKDRIKYYLILFITAVAGFLTHYYMLAVCGILTAFFCVYLLFQKKAGKSFLMGCVMLGAAVSSFLVFPSMLRVSGGQVEAMAAQNAGAGDNWKLRFRAVADFITRKSFGIPVPRISTGRIWIVLGYILYVIIVLIWVMVLFRRKSFVQRILQKLRKMKNGTCVSFADKKVYWIYMILAVACILQIYVVAETSNVWGMGNNEDRYLFYIYPVVTLLGTGLLCKVAGVLKNLKLRYGCLGLICFMIIAGQLWHQQNSDYYFPTYTEGMTIGEAVDGKYVVYIEENAWLLTVMTYKLMGCKEYLLTNDVLYRFHAIEYLDKMKEGELYLVLNTNYYSGIVGGTSEWGQTGDWEILDERYDTALSFFEDLVPETKMKLCSKETIFGRPMEIYCINPKE